jgi:uncharacterized membrane protein
MTIFSGSSPAASVDDVVELELQPVRTSAVTARPVTANAVFFMALPFLAVEWVVLGAVLERVIER